MPRAIGAPATSVAALGTTLPGTTAGAAVVVVLGAGSRQQGPARLHRHGRHDHG